MQVSMTWNSLQLQAWKATNNDQAAISSLLADAAEAEIQLRKTCVRAMLESSHCTKRSYNTARCFVLLYDNS